ncbi:type II toxin-antitoxin system RelE/ParE family toxin [Helicobacter jaachi]|uniref:Type II toxin-antitoxin system RelE/ParE family toxin n=1 Tax=Helicobacter jaachi TaxID=1677920 RepID=A0A4V6I2A6_9HELI|nr:type II toxin-antitoxin system RelE/ParE family toxin [Helicobacter jaachi]TLD95402.1 type II toxin-antitoxin system RelE/ParE family toxin [Helicobacter jaachi]
MQIIIPRKVDKFLEKQNKGDPKGVRKIRTFLWNQLSTAENPTTLPNCKKMQGTENIWRWRIGDYRIIAEIKNQELVIQVIKIAHRQEAYD